VFGTPGTFNFSKATYPWLARIDVQVQAGGGGSAGADAAAGEAIARPGGGGGGWAQSLIEASALGAVESIVVGAGGTAGAGNTAGGDGGNSSFGGLVLASGGDGGQATMLTGTSPTSVNGETGAAGNVGQFSSGGGGSGGAFRISGTVAMAGIGGGSQLGLGGFQRGLQGPGTARRRGSGDCDHRPVRVTPRRYGGRMNAETYQPTGVRADEG
jgi:hypothetical protein